MQELNRILFSALETSLVGTSGHDLINRLYHGTIVNQIVCKECKNVSEKQVSMQEHLVISDIVKYSSCHLICDLQCHVSEVFISRNHCVGFLTLAIPSHKFISRFIHVNQKKQTS